VADLISDYVAMCEKFGPLNFEDFIDMWRDADEIAKKAMPEEQVSTFTYCLTLITSLDWQQRNSTTLTASGSSAGSPPTSCGVRASGEFAKGHRARCTSPTPSASDHRLHRQR